jgi:hypothetical protein
MLRPERLLTCSRMELLILSRSCVVPFKMPLPQLQHCFSQIMQSWRKTKVDRLLMVMQEPLNIYELASRVQFLEEKIMDGIEQVKENQKLSSFGHFPYQIKPYMILIRAYTHGLKVVENTRQSDSKVVWLVFSGFCGALLTAVFTYLMK